MEATCTGVQLVIKNTFRVKEMGEDRNPKQEKMNDTSVDREQLVRTKFLVTETENGEKHSVCSRGVAFDLLVAHWGRVVRTDWW
jgi:hypothetical protein